MYFTHHFAHPETLARVKTWLIYLGLEDRRIESHADGIPRLALTIERSRLDAIRMLINAVERTDPDGNPSFWEMAQQLHGRPLAAAETATQGLEHGPEAIGWHPNDPTPAADPEFRELCEAMGRKWGYS